MRHTLVLLFSVLSLAACSTTPAGNDAASGGNDTGSGNDAATTPDTGGSTPDTGGSTPDMGTTADAGTDAAMAADANDVDASFSCDPHTFVVTSDGSSYTIDGVAGNPTIHMCHGVTYMFDLTAVSTFHPLGLYVTGTAAPVASFPGMVTTTYAAPAAAPFPDTYRCTIHGFGSSVVVR